MDFIIILLYFISFLVIWQFVGYALFMSILVLKLKTDDKEYSHQPFVSIIVPTYNEEKVIIKRIINLIDLDYPKNKYEILIVDSGSTDNTRRSVSQFILDYMEIDPKINIILEEERKGKASAINLGKSLSNGEIILVTDANAIFTTNVLKEMMPHFLRENVGAVGGQYKVTNVDTDLSASNQFYWDIEYLMRLGESKLYSACLFHGEINSWRKNLVEADISIVSEDLDMALQIRELGYKIVYEPNAVVYEPSPMTPREQIIQRKKNCIGTIKCIVKHIKYLILPLDYYRLLIFPSHKTLTVISPFLLISIPIIYLIIFDTFIILTHILVVILIFSILLFLLLKIRLIINKNREKSHHKALSLKKLLYFVILNEYLIVISWIDFATGRYSVLWPKIESNR